MKSKIIILIMSLFLIGCSTNQKEIYNIKLEKKENKQANKSEQKRRKEGVKRTEIKKKEKKEEKHKAKKTVKKKKKIIKEKEIIGEKIRFQWPCDGTISSGYGKRKTGFHYGIDITNDAGVEIFAVEGGVVIFSGMQKGYGNLIIVDHGSGITTYYAHNSVNYLHKGMFAKKGQMIGLIGETGRVKGPHLHFEIRYKGNPVNPLNYLPRR
jgi:murein DD-endopeptidase MepM/ murein hydrolase activator NlpD